jgi:hypothetical protein
VPSQRAPSPSGRSQHDSHRTRRRSVRADFEADERSEELGDAVLAEVVALNRWIFWDTLDAPVRW